MKTNLKNRPFFTVFDIIEDSVSQETFNKLSLAISGYNQFFLDLEKELRERIISYEQDYKELLQEYPTRITTAELILKAGAGLLGEILGDELEVKRE